MGVQRRFFIFVLSSVVLIFGFLEAVFAGEQGHYYPGIINVRDVVMPSKGLYFCWYNPYIFSDTYKDADGNKLDHITVSGSITKTIYLKSGSFDVTLDGTIESDIDVELDAFTSQAMFAWVTGEKVLGADYGIIIAPSFGYTRIKASADVSGAGTITVGPISRPVAGSTHVDFKDDKSGFGDLYIAPVWLGWHKERFDFAALYGFFAPTGAYDSDDTVNIGLGYWTHQLAANAIYYVTKNKATALMAQMTYGYHTEKSGFDLRPGQTLDLEYGISQYVHPRVELAVSGYNHWQVTDDTGTDARNKNVHDRIGGVGPQLGFWVKPQKGYLSLRYLWEYGGKDHFEDNIATVNFVWIF